MATKGEKEIRTNWPVISGIEADEKHDERQINLVYESQTNVSTKQKKGLE